MARTATTTLEPVGGTTVNGTFYRTPRKHHTRPTKAREIRSVLDELWTEGDTDAQYLRMVRI